MTVMPDHAARLNETASLLVLDPNLGPVARKLSALALGDEVLVVAAGRMCFRRIMSSEEAAPPDSITEIISGALGEDMPRNAMWIDSRQPVGTPTSHSRLTAAQQLGQPAQTSLTSYWSDVTAEGADKIVVDNVMISTGPLPEPTIKTPAVIKPLSVDIAPLPSGRPSSLEIVASNGQSPVRAFNGPAELALAGASKDGPSSIYRFVLPPRTTTLRLSSPSTQPNGDGRKLGVAILRLVIESIDIPLDSPALVRGFHRAESGEGQTWRWTDGDALMILPPKPVPQTLAVYITDWYLML